MDGGTSPVRITPQPTLPGLGAQPGAPAPGTRAYWLERLQPALVARSPELLRIAEAAVRDCPEDPALLLMAALTALVAEQADRALGLVRRFERKFEPDKAVTLLTGLALARQGATTRACNLLERAGLLNPHDAVGWFIGGRPMVGWLFDELARISQDP